MGAEILSSRVEDIIPAEVHGFSVKVGIGPFPPDQPRSSRSAVYADLRPVTEHTIRRMRHAGRERILSTVPLTDGAAKRIAADPAGRLAETVAQGAVRQAARLAKTVAE